MRILVVLCLSMLLASCSSVELDDYQGTRPDLKLEQFFDGKLVAYGIVLDRSGKMIRRFEVDLLASWQGNKTRLKNGFVLMTVKSRPEFGS